MQNMQSITRRKPLSPKLRNVDNFQKSIFQKKLSVETIQLSSQGI